MNVEIGTEAAPFQEKEYNVNKIFVAVYVWLPFLLPPSPLTTGKPYPTMLHMVALWKVL
jgi:hypothetical protein